MKCKKCGAANSHENKFCIQCGTELTNSVNAHSCPKCGFANDKSSRFCIECGNELILQKRNKKTTRKTSHKKSNRIKSNKRLTLLDFLQENKAVTGIAVLLVAFVIFQMLPSNESTRVPKYYSQNSTTNFAGFGGNKTFEIASKFICACGNCDKLSLETCSCPSAKEEKSFITSLVKENKSDLEIIKTVNAKYGWIKPQFKSLLTSTEKKANKNTTSTNSSLKLNGNVARFATMLDLSYIIGQFRCPCGQCGVDELKDCSCNHPNGSVEVKNFIRNKISKNSFTVNQIIEQVNETYGGKKI